MPDPLLLPAVRRMLARLPTTAHDDALAVINGAVGDRLHTARAATARPMAFMTRADPEAPVEVFDLAAPPARPPAPGVLLVHGLMGSPRSWALGTREGPGPDARVELGGAIARALGFDAMYLRYNTGRHISDNGRELAHRLEALHSRGTTQLDIVAHSMGGLVVRSALHYGLEAGAAWPRLIRRVILLGTPSHGAPLEQLAHVAAFTLETIWNPWTKLIGKAMNLRSAGIKDLRHGFCREDDWRHKDQDVLRLQRPRPTRAPPHIRWFVAAGTAGAPDQWVSIAVGDGLVRSPSARGHGFGTSTDGVLPGAEVRVFGHTGHIGLMTDPLVLRQVLDWLSSPDEPVAAP